MTFSIFVFQQSAAIRRFFRPIVDHLPILLTGGYLAFAVFSLAGTGPTFDRNDSLPVPTVASAPVARVDYAQIADWHLFGELNVAENGQPAIAETQLKLKLQGTFLASHLLQAAVIQAEDGSHHYKIGDQIPGGAVLWEVFADKVILSRNGRRESLALPRLTATQASIE